MATTSTNRQPTGLRSPRHKMGEPWGPCMGEDCENQAVMTKQAEGGRFFEVCHGCFHRIKRNGRPRLQAKRKPWLTQEQYSEAIELRRGGLPWRKIAKVYGKDPGNTRRMVIAEGKRRGVDAR